MLQEFLVKLQSDLELKEFVEGDIEESYAFMFDDVKIQIMESSPGFQFYAAIGLVPKEKAEEFLAHVLRGNFFGQATRNAWLGLDESGTMLVARLYFPMKASYKDFFEQLEDFINVVDFWKEELNIRNLA